MNDELITRTAVMESLTAEYNRKGTGDGLKLAWIEKAVSDTPSAQPERKTGRWIPCSERLPEERDSIFAKLYGTEKWRNTMFRKTSNTVIITVELKDGTRQTAPCHTIDGEWNQSIKGIGNVVAWMPLPEPYREDT